MVARLLINYFTWFGHTANCFVLRWSCAVNRTWKNNYDHLHLVTVVLSRVVAFFLACKDIGQMFNHSFPACVVCFFLVVVCLFPPPFFFKWRLAHTHLCHSLCQDQSTVAQWAEMTVAMCSVMNCMWLWACFFSLHFLTRPGQRHSQHTLTSLGKGVCMFTSYLPPALLAE